LVKLQQVKPGAYWDTVYITIINNTDFRKDRHNSNSKCEANYFYIRLLM